MAAEYQVAGLAFGKGALSLSKKHISLLFQTHECFRPNQSECYPPGHAFYAVTRNGLDMLFEVRAQAIHFWCAARQATSYAPMYLTMLYYLSTYLLYLSLVDNPQEVSRFACTRLM